MLCFQCRVHVMQSSKPLTMFWHRLTIKRKGVKLFPSKLLHPPEVYEQGAVKTTCAPCVSIHADRPYNSAQASLMVHERLNSSRLLVNGPGATFAFTNHDCLPLSYASACQQV